MFQKPNRLILILIILAFCLQTLAQTADNESKIFDKDGLSFSYPANWDLTDQSTVEMQQLKLSLANTSALIYINSPRKPITSEEQLNEAHRNISDQFIANIVEKFNSGSPLQKAVLDQNCSETDDTQHVGTIIRGNFQNFNAAAEVFPLFPEHRFINLVFIRNDKDAAQTSSTWETIKKSIKTLTPNAEKLQKPKITNVMSGSVLNGKALRLPAPHYPAIALSRNVRGAVSVNVEIDESGKVIAARAVSGDISLAAVSEAAARKALFSPTFLCGEAIKVTGVIIYNFSR